MRQLNLLAGAAEKGVVYTKPWVVDLILDLVGYRPDADLAVMTAVEPAAGEGAFLVPMVRRLIASARERGHDLAAVKRPILAYELDVDAAAAARGMVVDELVAGGISRLDAQRLARRWVVVGDYVLSHHKAPRADVIVGNPPYIRYDDLSPDLFAAYRDVCPTMVGRCDVYVAFVEAAIRQLKPGGRLGFICADRWMRAAYGAELRRYVAANAAVEAVIEMHNAPAFEEDVAAYPAVTILRKGVQGSAVVGSAGPRAGPLENGASLADALIDVAGTPVPRLPGFSAVTLDGWYGGDGPWPWADPETLATLRRLEAEFRPVEDAGTGTRVGIGVATGADQVFVVTDAAVAEEDRLLPLAMAHDTKGGTVQWSGHYLVNPWRPDGRLVDLSAYPRMAAYLAAHAVELRKRNVAGRHPETWYRTIDRVTLPLLRQDKLYFPDMKLEANPVLDRGKTYPHHNLYYITSDVWDLEVLGGLLLSKIAEMFVSSYCVKMRGGTLRFQAQYLRRIRVPDPASMAPDVCSRLRRAFQARDRAGATAAALEAYHLVGEALASA
jgi:adenine-specific DNA-methyltransferase